MAPDFEVEVGPGCVPCVPTQAYDLPPSDFLTVPDLNGGEVAVYCDHPSLVIQPNHLPVSAHGACKTNPAPGHGPYLHTVRNADVDSPMEIWFESLEAYAEGGNEAPFDRPTWNGTTSGQ